MKISKMFEHVRNLVSSADSEEMIAQIGHELISVNDNPDTNTITCQIDEDVFEIQIRKIN